MRGLGLVTQYLLNDFLNEEGTNVLVSGKNKLIRVLRENEQAGSSEQGGFEQCFSTCGHMRIRYLGKMQILTQQVWGAT